MSGPPPPPPPPPPPGRMQQRPMHYNNNNNNFQQQQQHPGQPGNMRYPQQMQQGMNMGGYGQTNRPYQAMPGGQQGNIRPQGMYQQRPRPYGMMNNQQGMHPQQQQQQQQRYPNQSGSRMMGRGGYHMNHPRPYQTMNQQQHQYSGQDNNDGTQQSTRPNKQVQRKTIDYYGATVRGLELRTGGAAMSLKTLPCDPSYTVDVFPPIFVPNEPETSMTTRFIWDSKNMVRYPVNVVRWMPDGRFLVTGSSSGEFTLWNGLTFKFETISSAHDTTIRSMKWSHNSEWMISGDSGGIIKYWQPNMNNVKIIQGHSKSVRELSFSPSDVKFVSASDDQQIKIWDFGRGVEEQTLNGHINEVRTVDWHPQLGMVSSSGKDKIIKLWDPRSGKCLSNIRAHNGAITGLQWNRNGRWLLSGGRDHSIKLFDIRNIKEELVSYSTNSKEIHSLAWHPIHETMFVSGGSKTNETGMGGEDGALQFWTTDENKELACVPNAHASFIWSLAWHPMGHILTSGSNDHSTRFWGRPRPGEYLPTELGGQTTDEVDSRIFGDTINHEAAEQLACFALKNSSDKSSSLDKNSRRLAGALESSDMETNVSSAVVPGGVSSARGSHAYDSDDSSASAARQSPAGVPPGLQTKDISRMLANIKKSGVVSGLPGLPGLGGSRTSTQSSTAGGIPGLSGISRSSQQGILPGLVNQQQQQQNNNRPVRHPDARPRQSSRFNPIQRNTNNNSNNNSNSSGQRLSSPPSPPPPPPSKPQSGSRYH